MSASRKIAVALSLLLIVCLSACSESPPPSERNPEQTLTIAIGASPQSLDPHLITGVPAMKILSALFEPLVVMDAVSEVPVPGVAETWTVSEDDMHYRFHLRSNAKWSDGSAITARDFVFTWKRILAPGISSLYAQEFYSIAGAAPYHQGKTRDFSTVGVKAIDDQTLEFTLVEPDALFLKRLSHAGTSPVQEANITEFAAFDDPVSEWTQPPNMISNGPFALIKWELNKSIEAVKNPYYWAADSVTLEKIVFSPVENSATTERMFRTGQLQFDYSGTIPAEKIETYKRNAPEKLIIQPGYASYYYSINTQKPPFDNVDVRRALAYAIDREMIVNRITKAGQQPAYTLSPLDDKYQLASPIAFDPEKARQFLADAGYPNGEGLPTITLKYNTNENHQKIAVAIQQMWKEHLNVNVVIENQEWKVFLATRYAHDFDVCRDAASSTYTDPLDMMTPFTSGHEMNTPDWRNPEYDALVQRARTLRDTEARMTLLKKAESILLDQVPVIPIYYYAYSYLISPEVKGMHFSRIEKPDFKSIYIEPSDQRH